MVWKNFLFSRNELLFYILFTVPQSLGPPIEIPLCLVCLSAFWTNWKTEDRHQLRRFFINTNSRQASHWYPPHQQPCCAAVLLEPTWQTVYKHSSSHHTPTNTLDHSNTISSHLRQISETATATTFKCYYNMVPRLFPAISDPIEKH